MLVLLESTNFPWVLSNVFDLSLPDTPPLAGGKEFFIIEKNGFKIGFMGLTEKAWLDTITEIDKKIMEYEDFIECAKRMNKLLREKYECNLVCAISHMRVPNDIKLAEAVPEVDIIFGGHDHMNLMQVVNETFFLKSGSDFKNFSLIKLESIDSKDEIALIKEK